MVEKFNQQENFVNEISEMFTNIVSELKRNEQSFKEYELNEIILNIGTNIVVVKFLNGDMNVSTVLKDLLSKLCFKKCLYICATCSLYSNHLKAIQLFQKRVFIDWKEFDKNEKWRESILSRQIDVETGEPAKYEGKKFTDEFDFDFRTFYHKQYKAYKKRKKSGVSENYIGLEGDLGIDVNNPIPTLFSGTSVPTKISDWSDSFDDLGPEDWENRS